MINPQELRLGNWVYTIPEREIKIPSPIPFKILEIGTFEAKAIMATDNPAQKEVWPSFKYENLSPIPLTPELLEAAGAEYIGKTEDVYKLPLNQYEYFVFGKMKTDKVFPMQELHFIDNEADEAFPYSLNEIEYLHQLQNLFFVHTGQELEIKLPVKK